MHKSSEEFRYWPDLTTDNGVSCAWASKIDFTPFFSVVIGPIYFTFVGNKDMYIILKEFEFRLDRTTNYEPCYRHLNV